MRIQLELPNEVAAELAGPGDAVMKTLEEHLDCEVYLRGNVLTLDGGDEVEVLQRERKRRLEAAEAYREGGADDRAEAEEREAEIIGSYMPEQISDTDLAAIVGDAIAESGATSPKEMGQVMALVMPQVKGRADGKRVSNAVKERLT